MYSLFTIYVCVQNYAFYWIRFLYGDACYTDMLVIRDLTLLYSGFTFVCRYSVYYSDLALLFPFAINFDTKGIPFIISISAVIVRS